MTDPYRRRRHAQGVEGVIEVRSAVSGADVVHHVQPRITVGFDDEIHRLQPCVADLFDLAHLEAVERELDNQRRPIWAAIEDVDGKPAVDLAEFTELARSALLTSAAW